MPAYVISEVTILNEANVEAYKPLAKQAVIEHGGEYLARDAVPDALEGSFEPDQRLVIIRFPDVEAVRAWYSSNIYGKALEVVDGGLDRRLFVVAGL